MKKIFYFILLIGWGLHAEFCVASEGDMFKRSEQLNRLKQETFDVLIIGGGATGCGIALDSATRGLKTALVEADDFASGTSSKSTKLVHGGVRYLEQAFMHLDTGQYHLVKEALHERKTVLNIAPHLTNRLPIVTPLYRWWEIPYYWVGLKLYDLLSGTSSIGRSSLISKQQIIEQFPHISQKGLKGGVLYYDGQFNDARMNVSLACTAALHNAAVSNYVEAERLVFKDNKVSGAQVKDQLTQESFPIKAKVVINATGPFSDSVRMMDISNLEPRIRGSAGTHILLRKDLCSDQYGILIPKTPDGRVIFMLPWEGGTLAGTTDIDTTITRDIFPQEEEILYLLEQISRYLDHDLSKSDVLSSWTGIRPLVQESTVSESSEVSRDHVIEVSPSGLISIMGGKWTTYRKMSEDAVDQAIEVGNLTPKNECVTEDTPVVGGQGFSREIISHLEKQFSLNREIAKHLYLSYGSEASEVLAIAQQGYGKRLSPNHPYIEAEVIYAVRREFACHVRDVLERRTRLLFLDKTAAKAAIPRIEELMRQELAWSEKDASEEKQKALAQIEEKVYTKI